MENVDDIYPLSPMQHLMLMHSIRVRGSSTLSNQFRYRLHGELDTAGFDRAWQHAIERHSVLRTAFVWEDVDEPLQVVRSRVDLPIEHVDLSTNDAHAQQLQLAQLERSDRESGFDLRRAPLMRLKVIHLGPKDHILVWSRHHLILDLWSADILFREVFADYESTATQGVASAEYRDYIEWLGHQDIAAAKAHYRDYLDGLVAPSLLFSDRARRSEWSSEGQAVAERILGTEHMAILSAFAQSHGLTLGSIIQGAVGLLIAESLCRDDVVYGLTVAGRPRDLDDVESILGTFINDVPVRARIDRSARLVDWLTQMQLQHAARQPFEYLSPIDVHRCSDLPSRQPLFDLLLLMNSPVSSAPPGNGSLTLEALPGPFDSAFPMTLAVEHHGNQAALTAVYDQAAITPKLAESILGDLDTWLDRIVRRSEQTLGELLPTPRMAPPAMPMPATKADTRAAAGAAESLLDIWRHTLGIDDIGLDDDFFALGGTSIQAAIAFTEIERRLGRDLPLSVLFRAGSVRALLKALDEPVTPAPSLVTIQRLGDRPPVLACSGIGGNVVGLSGIARALGEAQPFFGLQPAGLTDGEAPAQNIEDIASTYVSASKPTRKGPIVLLGICFGANVMLEMAQQLAAAGQPPALLIVMDPVYDDREAAPAGPDPTMLGFLRDRLRLYIKTYRSLDRLERQEWVRSKYALLRGKVRKRDMLHGNHFEMRQRRLQAANLTAMRNYEPTRYAGETRVLLTGDRTIDLAEDPRQQWVVRVAPSAEITTVPGRDTGQAVGQYAAIIADQVRRWINPLA